MSLSTLITFAILLKKITRRHSAVNPQVEDVNAPLEGLERQFDHETDTVDSRLSSNNKCTLHMKSSWEDVTQQLKVVKRLSSTKSYRVSIGSRISASKRPIDEDEGVTLCVIKGDDAEQDNKRETEKKIAMEEKQTEVSADALTSEIQPTVLIRDFAFPVTSPHHWHEPVQERRMSLSSADFTGCHARALYDFVPETEYEIAMTADQLVWVQYRQYPGWLVADVNDETGLIPESYVELL